MNALTEGQDVWRVRQWRFDELVKAGWPAALAAYIAEHEAIDLHIACELLTNGATVDEALAILL